ncbi:MAG: hypothetical protein ACYTGW_20975 [Planctomycetota bacterium]|jgi:hypothetical protein
MNRFVSLTLALTAVVLASAVSAQAPKYRWSPTGTNKFNGGANNTIPFWGKSASYQQIHDAVDFGVLPVQMKGMAMRPQGNTTLPGRTWEMRITLSHTKVTANTMSTTFATNLAGLNTTIVYGTSTTFTKFSWTTSTSSGTTVPKPPTFTIPFTASYLYLPALGNLCWDWRHKNATLTSFMVMDATSGSSQRGKVLSKVGNGCFVKGNVAPATATITTALLSATGYNFQSTLTNATRSSSAIMALGLTQRKVNPGWCTAVELVPVAFVFGKTDTLGSWQFRAPLALLAGAPPTSLHVQYAYNDTGQAGGLGLSDMAGYTTPNVPGGNSVTRVYKASSSGTVSGDELATTGSRTYRYGLVVGWLQ